jgi:3-(3-hydroxy-phenyl)propionate hydroxylase
MMTSTEASAFDVIVIGAGPTGLTLAGLLARQAVNTLVIDRSRLPVHHPRATHLDDETMRTFQALGLQDFERSFSPVGVYRFVDAQLRPFMAMAMDRGVTEQGWRSDYMFHQPDFEALMRGRLRQAPTVSASFGWEATEISAEDDLARVVATERSTGIVRDFSGRFVVGCDGAHSLVRSVMNCEMTDYHASHRSLIVDIFPYVKSERLSALDAFIQAGVRNPLTVVPTAAPRLRFEVMLRPEDDADEFTRIDHAYDLVAPWFAPDEFRMLRADVYQWEAIVATAWRCGPLLVAGDSAHEMPPHLGQGMCTGIRDTANLAWKLGRVLNGTSDAALLDTYQTERIPHASQFVSTSAQMANEIESMKVDVPANAPEPELRRAEPLRPNLGPGVLSDTPHAGVLSWQPRLDDGSLLDDVVGYRFVVIGSPECVRGATEHTRAAWQKLDAQVIESTDAELLAWTQKLGANVVIIRPDRYVYGTAESSADLDQLTRQLSSQLLTRQALEV